MKICPKVKPKDPVTKEQRMHAIYFAKPKDPVTKEQRTDAIYSIPCNDCDNEYIGQTKRQFGTRLKKHQKAVFLCKKENSALSEHTCLTNVTMAICFLTSIYTSSEKETAN